MAILLLYSYLCRALSCLNKAVRNINILDLSLKDTETLLQHIVEASNLTYPMRESSLRKRNNAGHNIFSFICVSHTVLLYFRFSRSSRTNKGPELELENESIHSISHR